MARLARIVAPDCPHHVTARGNRREPIFFEDGGQDLSDYGGTGAMFPVCSGCQPWANSASR